MRGFEANLLGPVFDHSGYANYFQELATQLLKLGRCTIGPIGPQIVRNPKWEERAARGVNIEYPNLLVCSPHQLLAPGEPIRHWASIHSFTWLTMWEAELSKKFKEYFFGLYPWKALITTSQFCAAQVREWLPVHVVPNHVDAELFRPRPQPENERFVFGMAGAWVGRKGWEVLRDAWVKADLTDKAVLKVRPTIEVASRATMHDVRVFFKDCENVEIDQSFNPEPNNRSSLLDFYSSLDLHLYPSFGDTIPKSVLEPGAMGVPTLGSDSTGIQELISSLPDGNTYLFDAAEEAVPVPSYDDLYGGKQSWHYHDWHPPSADDLASKLTEMVEIGPAQHFETGVEWSKLIRKKYSARKAAVAVRDIWRQLYDLPKPGFHFKLGTRETSKAEA